MKRERRKCEGYFRVDGGQLILWTDQLNFRTDWKEQQDFRSDGKELQKIRTGGVELKLRTDELYFLTDVKLYFRLDEEVKLEDHVGCGCCWKELVKIIFGLVG